MTEEVFGIRLKDLFGNPLGGRAIAWSSNVAEDVVVSAGGGGGLGLVPLTEAWTSVLGFHYVRVFLADAGVAHVLRASVAGSAPLLLREFMLHERGRPGWSEVEVRLVHSPADQGFQGAAETTSPVAARFEALVREPGGSWELRGGDIEVFATAEVDEYEHPAPLPLAVNGLVATGAWFYEMFGAAEVGEQELRFRAVRVDGVATETLPQLYAGGALQRQAHPQITMERLTVGQERQTVPAGGLALTSDAGVVFAVANLTTRTQVEGPQRVD